MRRQLSTRFHVRKLIVVLAGLAMLAITSCSPEAIVTARAVDEVAGQPTREPLPDLPATTTETPTAVATPEPTVTQIPLPTPTPTPPPPEPQLTGFASTAFEVQWRPPPSSDEDHNVDDWPDNLQFLSDGIGSYRAGIYPLGSEIDPIVNLISGSLGQPDQSDGGSYSWGEPEPAVQIWAVDGRLTGWILDLTTWSSEDPVYAGETFLTSEAFPFNEVMHGEHRLIAIAYDDDGRLVRCSAFTACFHQPLTLKPADQANGESRYLNPYGLGWVERVSAGWNASYELQVDNYVTSVDGSPVKVHVYPQSDSRVLIELADENTPDIPVIGSPIDAGAAGTWFRVLLPDHPFVPAGYIDGASVAFAATPSDASGVLPRLDRRPNHLASFVGLRHSDPFDDFEDVVAVDSLIAQLDDNVDAYQSVSAMGSDYNMRLSEFETDRGLNRIFVLSEPQGAEDFAVVQIWEMRAAQGQAITDGSSGRCPFLEGGDNGNAAKIVVDTNFQPIAGWIWLDLDYQPVDVSQVSCNG